MVDQYHKPVLLNEVLELLDPKPGGVYVDATLGGGGHSEQILERIGPDGILIGIDRDPEALEYTRKRLAKYGDRAILVSGNFRDFKKIISGQGFSQIDGALFDLGVSSHQLDAERGFSFSRDEALDMRMNPNEDTPSAADIVKHYTEEDLADIIWKYGEERYSRRIARAIVSRRQQAPITRTADLAEIITAAIPGRGRGQDIHPATRSFQGIRIEVNRELESIEIGVPEAIESLSDLGRVVVISFHSLEDGLIKNIFRKYAGKCQCPPRLPVCQCGAKEIIKILTKKPVVPTAEEVDENPRARSSRLRAAQHVG